jgi:hypothetical protein
VKILTRRDALASCGLALSAVGLAHRMAFFSLPGLVLVVLGFLLLSIAFTRPAGGAAAYPVLFVLLCVVAALAPFDPGGVNAPEACLTVGAAAAFYLLGAFRSGRAWRTVAAASLLVTAHAHYLLRFSHPLHQDVWTFLNGGADLIARGRDPYLGVAFVEDGLRKTVHYTYPPGALVELSPFRWFAGDVRWAYVGAEALVVILWWWQLRREGAGDRWREALVLVPLALPRTSQAFYIFTNHEWELLALALVSLTLAWGRRYVIAGLVLGLGIASKQYFLVFPALFLLPVVRARALGIGLATAVAITAPFLAWAPRATVGSILGNITQDVDPDRLTVWAALAHAGINAARPIQLAAVAVVAILGLAAGVRVRGDLRLSLAIAGVSLAAFALVSTFAAYNYYAYGLILVTWALLIPDQLAGSAGPALVRDGHGARKGSRAELGSPASDG